MKKTKPRQREPVQLHMDPTPAETTPEYTLEDIMNEFGGWSRRTPDETGTAADEAPEVKAPEQPEPAAGEKTPGAPEAAAEKASPEADVRTAEKPEEKAEKQPDLSAQTMRFAPVTAPEAKEEPPKIWTYKGEPTPDDGERVRLSKEELRQRQRQKKLALREARQAQRREKRQEKPERTFASPEEAYAFYCRPDSMRLRLLLTLLLTVSAGVLLTLMSGVIPGTGGHTALFSALTLVALIVQAALCLDVLADGLRAALHGRFDLNSLLLLTLLVTLADAVFALLQQRIPFCAALSVQMAVALWARMLRKSANYKTMKAVCSMPNPSGAVRGSGNWHGMDCVFRIPGDRDEFVRKLEMPDAPTRWARGYAPVLACLTLALAVPATLRGEQNLLWAWAALLLAGFPTGLYLSYVRPFRRLANRLYRRGAAVAGWSGARTFAGECAVTVMDQDLFPAGTVTLNGMKIYSDRSVSQIIGFASAVVQTAGSGLTPLFDEMMHSQNGRHYRVDTFRRYEGGGLGAEIQGDVILMGSIGFMKLMKVRMPEGTRLKQAVYLSVNGDLAAVFALNYAPNAAVRDSLNTAVHTGGLLPLLATRDFMITPQFLKLRYKIASERVEFPTVEERARLSEPDAGRGGAQGALLARGTLESFLAAVTGARSMRAAAVGSIAVAVMGGVMGVLVMCFLTFLGATLSASCWNLFLYTLLWLLPGILMTGLSVRR